MKGRIENTERLYGGEYRISLVTHQNPELTALMGKDVNISIKAYREGRSRDANAYYWKILSEVAEALHVSKPFMHNQMLRKYGQLEEWGGRHIITYIADTDEATKQVDEDQYHHFKPTSGLKLGNDGVMYRAYKLIRGSSSYDTKEMSELISGLVTDAEEIGINTMTPDEIKQLKEQWGVEVAKKNKSVAI